MDKRILDNLTPAEAMTSRFSDMLGQLVDVRVKRTLRKNAAPTTEEQRSEAIAMYQSIIDSMTSLASDKMRARQRLDVLQGLEAEAASGVTGEALLAVLANAQATLGAVPLPPPTEDAQKPPIAAEEASADAGDAT